MPTSTDVLKPGTFSPTPLSQVALASCQVVCSCKELKMLRWGFQTVVSVLLSSICFVVGVFTPYPHLKIFNPYGQITLHRCGAIYTRRLGEMSFITPITLITYPSPIPFLPLFTLVCQHVNKQQTTNSPILLSFFVLSSPL